MGALAYTVWVKTESGGDSVAFGPDDEEIPGWALEQMGDHCFVDGERPDGGSTSYDSLKKAELEDRVEKRNADRADADKIVVGGNGTKADLIAALEADDQASRE